MRFACLLALLMACETSPQGPTDKDAVCGDAVDCPAPEDGVDVCELGSCCVEHKGEWRLVIHDCELTRDAGVDAP